MKTRTELEAKYNTAFKDINEASQRAHSPTAEDLGVYFSAEAAARRLDEYLANFSAQPVFSVSTGSGGC